MDANTKAQLTAFVEEALNLPRGSGAYQQLTESIQELLQELTSSGEPDLQKADQLAALLDCISTVASLLNEYRHETLLRALYSISPWQVSEAVGTAWINLLQHIIAVRPAFLQPCIDHVVRSFLPPLAMLSAFEAPSKAPYSTPDAVQTMHSRLCACLSHMLTHQPLSAPLIRQAIADRLPHKLSSCQEHCIYLHALFKLADNRAGDCIRDSLFVRVVEKLVEMDCEIRWEEIVDQLTGQEDEEGSTDQEEEDLFGMEDGVEVDVQALNIKDSRLRHDSVAVLPCSTSTSHLGWEGCPRTHAVPATAPASQSALKSLQMAEKLDQCMFMTFAYMERCTERGQGRRLWAAALEAFDKSILLSHRVKFSPYVVYLAASLGDGSHAKQLVQMLLDRIVDPAQPLVVRTTCAAYCGSFLARFAALPLKYVISSLARLTHFALSYAASSAVPDPAFRSHSSGYRVPGQAAQPCSGLMHSARSAEERASGPPEGWELHEIFYAVSQVIMYVLCYHMCTLSRPAAGEKPAQCDSELRALVKDQVVPLLQCKLRPGHVCLPTVVSEFVKQLQAHGIADVGHTLFQGALGPSSRVGRAFEMFFPFDPYLLPLSAPRVSLDCYYRSWRHGHVVGGHDGDGGATADHRDDVSGLESQESDSDTSDHESAVESEDDQVGSLRLVNMEHAGTSPVYTTNFMSGNPFAGGVKALPRPVGALGHAKVNMAGHALGGSTTSDGYLNQSYASSPMHSLRRSPEIDAHVPSSLMGSSPGAAMMSCTPDVPVRWPVHMHERQ